MPALSATRVLFIDIDGVLHLAREPGSVGPSDTFTRVGHFGWLAGLAELLRPYPDVAVVVHSSWRLAYSVDELREMLFELGERPIAVTPPGERYASVLAWLRGRPEASYRILDDEASEFPQPPPAELIVCDPKLGVSGESVREALASWLDG